MHAACLVDKFRGDKNYGDYESAEEHQDSCETEEMHRFLAEGAEEPQRKQIQEAVHETLQTEFALSVFPFLMMYRLFRDSVETCIFREVGDIAVHLAIDLYIFYNLVLIRFQSAIHVVKADAGNPTRGSIVQL